MRRKKALISLIATLVVAAGALAYTIKVENRPLLGLDLQGGVSVVLKPKGTVDDERVQEAISIMNQRINSLGVSEPDIHREGETIVVQIAGVKDRDKAIDVVGRTAELRFRSVLEVLTDPAPTTPGSSPPGTDATGSSTSVAPSTTAPGAITPAPSGTAPTSGSQQGAQPLLGGEGESAAGAVSRQVPPTTVTDQAPTTTAAPDPNSTTPAATTVPEAPAASQATTPREEDDPTKIVILPGAATSGQPGVRYRLAPAGMTGSALTGASAALSQQGQWEVLPKFKGGAEGMDKFNEMSAKCKPPTAECPTGQIAITLDGEVLSAPRIQPQQATFTPFTDSVSISGSFDQDSATNVATALKYGALPVELEQQSTQDISATIGLDALHAGLVAGFVGLVLVALYMLAFYRFLGLLALCKLAVEGAVLWSVISWLGQSAGLALTLAGVTGIIVSIGVSLDSNIVYYEHLREDVRNGRTLRSAADKSFHSSISTILKADGASLLGALLLYWLAVGPVRGFAFFLALSTGLDLISSYLYMRPVVFLALNSNIRPSRLGLPAPSVPAGGGAEPALAGSTRPSKRRGRTPVGALVGTRSSSSSVPSPPEDAGHSNGSAEEPDTDPATTGAN
jgi:preprotein translocase subunit SecD